MKLSDLKHGHYYRDIFNDIIIIDLIKGKAFNLYQRSYHYYKDLCDWVEPFLFIELFPLEVYMLTGKAHHDI